jgi:hypothetical protein
LSGRLSIIGTEHRSAWHAVLGRCPRHDFYHLAEYHALAEERREGEARLFAYEDGVHVIALPLLLRDVSSVEGLDAAGEGLRDAISVYGYCGPVVSEGAIPEPVGAGFRDALEAALRGMKVVSVFSRLHPLLPQASVLGGMGECAAVGQTVSIDLTASPEAQRAAYRKGHTHDLKKLRRSGIVTLHDRELRHLNAAVEIYRGTMLRLEAASYYLFDRAYFDRLLEALGRRVHLFVTLLDDEVTSAGFFVECGGTLQYHLSGTAQGHAKSAPTKLLLDDVRLWATARGLKTFHLGGGRGGEADSLFAFKAGFSPLRHEFRLWRWVVDSGGYAKLCAAREAWRGEKSLAPVAGAFFPAYRA